VVATSSPIGPPQGPQAGLNIPNNSRCSSQNSGVRLPKISLPRFNGDITRFYSFWQSFESAIDKKDSLTAVDKFNYLVNILEGEAFRVVQGLEIVEEHYDHSKGTLYQRFGHKQKIIFDDINVRIRVLESLGVRQENYGSLLIIIIMKRIPKDVALQVARETKSDIVNEEHTRYHRKRN